jgi:hypothetical protein
MIVLTPAEKLDAKRLGVYSCVNQQAKIFSSSHAPIVSAGYPAG